MTDKQIAIPTSTTNEDKLVVDALPYIDQGYDEPGVRDAALHMVEEETRRFRPTKNYLEHLGLLNLNAFETDMMKSEYERIQSRMPMEALDMKRYELDPPTFDKRSNFEEWNISINHSYASLQHQIIRLSNMELLNEYGSEVWRNEVETLMKLVVDGQNKLQALKKKIQEVNWNRKNSQMKAGEHIHALEAKWVALVSKNYEIEQACSQLEKDIEDAEMRRTEAKYSLD